MSMNDYEKHDGLGLAELVRRGETTPAELLDAALARIDARNPALNAVVTPLADAARREVGAPRIARHAVEARLGRRRQAELGRVGLAGDHEPGPPEARDDLAVGRRDLAAVKPRGRSDPRRPPARR